MRSFDPHAAIAGLPTGERATATDHGRRDAGWLPVDDGGRPRRTSLG
jgi:hypothetical protein